MKNRNFLSLFLFVISAFLPVESANQTSTVDTPGDPADVPFTVRIEQATLEFPVVTNPGDTETNQGVQGYAYATQNGKWLILCGKTTGGHNFLPGGGNFPPKQQNKIVYVVDTVANTISYRFLTDPSSGLSDLEVEYISAQVPEFFQLSDSLVIVGGYGVDSAISSFSTKPILTKLDIAGVINWVETGEGTFKEHMFQIEDPMFQVTGGIHHFSQRHKPLLITFGQNFIGPMFPSSNGIYTKKVKSFYLGGNPDTPVLLKAPEPAPTDAYRRRDLNSVPIIVKKENTYDIEYVVLSGVFTLTGGVWNVPVFIDQDGHTLMADPDDPNTFKQGVNCYHCARLGLYSKESEDMFIVLFGGIGFLYWNGTAYADDLELPYTNDVSAVKIDTNRNVSQFRLDADFPSIVFPGESTDSFFGSEAWFIPTYEKTFPKSIISLDTLSSGEETFIGYIVSGIQSKLRVGSGGTGNSLSSPYIFKVYVTKK